ncbi:MAG TPA: TonB family protein [Kofleriaceae bacterium]|nr:TonB family protein [Kofleriaceae bacterium]
MALVAVSAAVIALAAGSAHAQMAADAGPSPTPDAGPTTNADAGPSPSSDGGPTPPSDGGPTPPSDGGAQPHFEPPTALGSTAVPYPAGAPAHTEPVVVTVKLTVDATGAVTKVERLTAPQPVFDDAVIAAAKRFRFDPGRFGGKPVPVAITFTHTFLPPPPPAPPKPTGPPKDAVLGGKLIAMGSRSAVKDATVIAIIGHRRYVTTADDHGQFKLPVPAGAADIRVSAPGFKPFLQAEKLASKEKLLVTYYVERERYDPYEIVVVGNKRRTEVSRITLRGAEIKQVPGTFGDPFRVIQTLPGVASIMSLLPFPIVRGASPSSTGFLLDGTRVPLLYHLLGGPSVIHPDFIDNVDFYPGGAPVLFGGYTGGIVNGRTARARPDEHLIDVDVNLLQAGGLVRQPVPEIDAVATVAARYGYPGLILSLVTDDVSLSYWDYQLRLDGGNARNGWTVFAFGASDVLSESDNPEEELEPSLILRFHRLDLRFRHGSGRFDSEYRVVTGIDETLTEDDATISTFVVEPQARWRWRQSPSLSVVAGIEGAFHHVDNTATGTPEGDDVDDDEIAGVIGNADRLFIGSALTEILWRPTSRWLIRPGIRGDVLDDGDTTQTVADPRLTVRYRLATRHLIGVDPKSDQSGVWLKGSAGIYHQPPRFLIPLPGLDIMPLKYGMLRAIQTSAGIEVPLEAGFEIGAETFFNYLDPTVFDLAINDEPSPTMGSDDLEDLLAPGKGRAYGLEVLIRRRSRTGLFGWLSYTLSRSERLRDGDWVAYDFDRSHLLNLVAGLPMKRHWDIGLRFQHQSGRPVTTTRGYNAVREHGYTRIDLRVDKHAVWQSWILDFYVDVINVALFPEEVEPGDSLRYVLPTIGLRGRF